MTSNIPAAEVVNGTMGKVVSLGKDYVVVDLRGFDDMYPAAATSSSSSTSTTASSSESEEMEVLPAHYHKVPMHSRFVNVTVKARGRRGNVGMLVKVTSIPIEPAWAINNCPQVPGSDIRPHCRRSCSLLFPRPVLYDLLAPASSRGVVRGDNTPTGHQMVAFRLRL